MNSYQAQKSLLSWIILHCPLWPVWLYHTFAHLIKTKKKMCGTLNACLDFLYSFYLKHFSC